MPLFDSRIDPRSEAFAANRDHMLRMLAEVRALEQRTRDRSAQSQPLFDKRGQLLPRDRIALLLDPGSAYLELSALAGFGLDHPDPAKCVPGAGVITGIGMVGGTRCMVVASDSGIEAGSFRAMALEKILRAQRIALDNKLPFVHLVESAGANLLRYKVEGFVGGGAMFRNLARLSAAGLPVVTVVHGSSTAGGAYMPGLSDYVIMVRGRARAFLAGPPLLKAATGEIATEENLGGAEMHTAVSGLGEYMAENDADGVRLAREVVKRLQWSRHLTPGALAQGSEVRGPRFDSEDLLGIMSPDGRKPADMREVIARIVDDSDFLEFKSLYGPSTVTAHAAIRGHAIGIITNNGPIDPDGANKATHFIQACCQSGTPIVYLQNTTGYMVGQAYERGGMIKHGSKMIQAVANATVPQLTVMCGASFGAGHYGMCGRAYEPSFLFSWPNARTAVMGGEQAAMTMRIVAEAGAKRKGLDVDEAALDAQDKAIVDTFERQQSAIATSSLLLDDGVIDPRDTRDVLALSLTVLNEAARRTVRPIQFGVARP
ncbi:MULTISPECIES: acyl-CoA carboxylase subunit beta [Burkholderiales]|jgi:geranyl-CoA carboxylase beta subunit|uniref:Methylmalonyl-CoA carboxyltransferase 12S subunit n=2 Tax=Burkholderiales TaxID=80840 RepID=A0AAD2J6J2_ACHAE|nr:MULTISPECIES: carboxyl transferase domain-containing protein [Achromobacter]MCA0324625.1 acyl-CoA carboxylase subunit beta [Pseudomonadota bacterium]CAB3922179.1 Methylmalonyl-CoA carboxyltransferase 12S subunit [Achromobacter mucicolens]CUJ79158.1 Methylmalonyl-CoA carboxyltransferase 12S subunit [Achromobacter aegrifaciens]